MKRIPIERFSQGDRDYVTAHLENQNRTSGLESGVFAERIKGEWVKVGKEEFGLPFQLYGTKQLKRMKQGFPLFIHLHGASARADDVTVGKVEIAAKRLSRDEQYSETPCLIVVPTCPPDTYWGDHVKSLEAIVDGLAKALPIDGNRIYLSGYSMGARGIGAMLDSRPQFYAAAMFADGDTKHEWVDKVDSALWLWFSKDRDMAKAEAVAKAYSGAGKKAHFEGFDELTHNQIHWKLAHDEEVFPWIFSQVRKP